MDTTGLAIVIIDYMTTQVRKPCASGVASGRPKAPAALPPPPLLPASCIGTRMLDRMPLCACLQEWVSMEVMAKALGVHERIMRKALGYLSRVSMQCTSEQQ